jgi:hypothetical protein
MEVIDTNTFGWGGVQFMCFSFGPKDRYILCQQTVSVTENYWSMWCKKHKYDVIDKSNNKQ